MGIQNKRDFVNCCTRSSQNRYWSKIKTNRVYCFIYSWYDLSTAQTVQGKETESIETIRQFYAFVINGVS